MLYRNTFVFSAWVVVSLGNTQVCGAQSIPTSVPSFALFWLVRGHLHLGHGHQRGTLYWQLQNTLTISRLTCTSTHQMKTYSDFQIQQLLCDCPGVKQVIPFTHHGPWHNHPVHQALSPVKITAWQQSHRAVRVESICKGTPFGFHLFIDTTHRTDLMCTAKHNCRLQLRHRVLFCWVCFLAILSPE